MAGSLPTANGSITITGYTGPGGAVAIPASINGLPVTSIGSQAFQYCASLTSVAIPDSVTSIGASALMECFGLTHVTIGSGVTNIGVAAFVDCASLTTITVDTLNPCYSSVGGLLFNKSQTTLVQYPGARLGVTRFRTASTDIGACAFMDCTSLTGVTICSSVVSIEEQAFCFCIGLTSLGIPNSVTSIGNGALAQCYSLTNLTIGSGVTNIEVPAFWRLHQPDSDNG